MQTAFVTLASNSFFPESILYIFSCMKWRHGGALPFVYWLAGGRCLARVVLGLCSSIYEKGEVRTRSPSKRKGVTVGREVLVCCSSQEEAAGWGTWIVWHRLELSRGRLEQVTAISAASSTKLD